MRTLCVVGMIAVAFTGCASVPMGDAKRDASLKTFVASPAKAGLYIYRNESIGGAVRMDVEIDGKSIGQTGPKTYLYKEVAPGKHVITSRAENADSLEIDAKPGTLAFIWQEVTMGILYARTKLHLVSESEGKAGVLETQLAETR